MVPGNRAQDSDVIMCTHVRVLCCVVLVSSVIIIVIVICTRLHVHNLASFSRTLNAFFSGIPCIIGIVAHAD